MAKKTTRSRQLAWQKKQRALGLCVLCAEPAWRDGSAHCERHRIIARERMRTKAHLTKQLRAERREAQRCTRCGNKLRSKKYRLCKPHRAAQLSYTAQFLARREAARASA